MEHVVFFPAHDGTPAFRRVSSLEDAVRLVEHLRNVENVAELSVHALTEVPLAFKAVYKVEIPTEAVEATGSPAPAQELPPPLPVVDAAPVAQAIPSVVPDPAPEAAADVLVDVATDAPADGAPVPALAASNGHAEDTPSSLGFFAS